MKKKIELILGLVILQIIFFSIFNINRVKAEVINGTVDGSEGNVTWSFDQETGTLMFDGNGEITKNWSSKSGLSRKDIKKIIIKDNITGIYPIAFLYYNNLEEFIVENNQNYSCVDGVLFNKEKTELFQYPAQKKELNYEIPDTVTKINEYAFCSNNNLKKVFMPDSVTELGAGVFYLCSNVEEIILSENITKIESNYFLYCTNLKQIKIPQNVETIAEGSFVGCNSLNNIYVEDNTKFCSENGVLFDSNKKTLICYPAKKNADIYEIPDTVIEISKHAFRGNELSEIIIPSSVTKIGYEAFSYSQKLKKIVVPESVKDIEDNIFSNCSVNINIYCKSNSEILKYAKCIRIIDDNAPEIGLKQQDNTIVVTATDSGAGLNTKAYSIDNKNWTSNNTFLVEKSGTYTVYVKDRLGNIANKNIDIIIKEKEDLELDETEPSKENETQKNEETQNKEPNGDIKNQSEDKPVKDTSIANKEFGQYGSSSLIVVCVIVTSVLTYIGYKKLKY